ncbi:glycosyltransferase family 8 protein [Mycena capillaripes]|nr:glycosyltransferase family 8 protein [Mycena capillaripes]
MSSLFSRFFDRRKYDPLPVHSDRPSAGGKKRSQYKVGAALVVTLAVIAFVWLAATNVRGQPYSPLDHYQNINPLPVTFDAGAGPSPSSRRAVVSSMYSDGFAMGLAVVGHSTRSANVSARLLLPYLEKKVSEKALCIVRATGWEPYAVKFIPSPHGGKGIHPRFMDQYTKLNIWKLDQMGVDSAVYLDADTLVRRNFDELFDSPFNFAATPDVYGAGDPRGFSHTFNAGVLAFRPSTAVFENMREKIETAEYPLEQAEQAFLNLYFGGTAMRLPYVYNANLAMKARSPVLWKRLVDEMRVVHYTMVKPFLFDAELSDRVLSLGEVDAAMNQGAGGYYGEEVAWWRTAYERMMLDHGHAITKCYGL